MEEQKKENIKEVKEKTVMCSKITQYRLKSDLNAKPSSSSMQM